MLFESELDADIKIITKTKSFHAHKIILKRSSVLKAMLSIDMKEAKEGIILINDIEYDVLYEMVRYLYYDEVKRMDELALDLLVAADKYDIPKLLHECKTYLKTNVRRENFGKILITIDKIYGVDDLKRIIINFITE